MDKDLMKKLAGEQPLTAEETLRLDEALERGNAGAAARTVAALAEDAPSLAWRSRLNERLASVSRRRRTALAWRLGTAAAALAACTFVAVSLMRPVVGGSSVPRQTVVENTKKSSLEDAIIAEHRDATNEASLGIHVSFDESQF